MLYFTIDKYFFIKVVSWILLDNMNVFLSGDISVKGRVFKLWRDTPRSEYDTHQIYVRELWWTPELVVLSFLYGQQQRNVIHPLCISLLTGYVLSLRDFRTHSCPFLHCKLPNPQFKRPRNWIKIQVQNGILYYGPGKRCCFRYKLNFVCFII